MSTARFCSCGKILKNNRQIICTSCSANYNKAKSRLKNKGINPYLEENREELERIAQEIGEKHKQQMKKYQEGVN